MKDRHVAAVAPSSHFLLNRVLKHMPSLSNQKNHILELGAGDGPLTKRLLKEMSPDSRLIVFEPHLDFFNRLSAITDSRLSVYRDMAQNIPRYPEVFSQRFNYIVASFPFSKLESRTAFLDSIISLLNPEGELIIFNQYIPFGLGSLLKRYFRTTIVEVEWLNIPPCLNFFSFKKTI